MGYEFGVFVGDGIGEVRSVWGVGRVPAGGGASRDSDAEGERHPHPGQGDRVSDARRRDPEACLERLPL